MTVGAAIVVPGKGAVIGCDSRVTGGNGGILTDSDQKWLIAGSAVSICAGELGGVWVDLRETPPRTWRQLRETFKAAPGNLNFEALAYDRRAAKLFWSNNAGDELDCGLFSAIGSGGDVALGVLESHQAPKTLAEAQQLVHRALEVACKYNCACGGALRTLVVPTRGKITLR